MIKLSLGGVDKTQYLKDKSLKIDMDSSHFKTCSCTLTNITINDGVPEEGKSLRIDYVDNGNTMLLFEGLVDSKEIKALANNSNKLEVKVSSNGYRYVPYRRTVTEFFDIPNGQDYISANYIINYLVSTYLSRENIAYANMTAFEGKRYEDSQEFICMTVGDILDQLAKDSNGNWYIDSYRNLYFVKDYDSWDGINNYDIDVDTGINVDFRNPQLKTSIDGYANKVFFKGDLEDTDLNDIAVYAQDDSEIARMAQLDGGSGVYGIVAETNPNIKTRAEAEEYCQQVLSKKKAKPKILTFETFDWLAYQVGQRNNIHIPALGISNIPSKPKNYIVESIALTDLGHGNLQKQIEMRQLFPNGQGGYTWTKSANGMRFFQSLVQGQKQTDVKAKNLLKNHLYVENLRGGIFSTQNLEGNGDYIQLERQYMTFWDSATKTVKMAQGFIRDKDGYAVPGIVFGAGDGQGNNRGYITKGSSGLDIFYITPTGGVARVRLGNDGKLYLNDTEINAFSPSSPIPSTYLQQASYWNKALDGMYYDGVGDQYYVPSTKLTTGVNSSIGQGTDAYAKFTNPAYGFVDSNGKFVKERIAAASDWDAKVDGTYPKFTKITDTGVYTGNLSASQITSGTIAAERIAVLPDANISSASSWVKSSDGKFTYITSTGVYTGTVSADNISGGTISGITYQTSSNVYGDRIKITSDPYIKFYDTGTIVGYIYPNTGTLQIAGANDAKLKLSGGTSSVYNELIGEWRVIDGSLKNQSGDAYVVEGHVHDSRYYTESESDSRFIRPYYSSNLCCIDYDSGNKRLYVRTTGGTVIGYISIT